MTETDNTARAILRTNDRGGYCVPTARLYPFQWNWDSGFVAMGWACFDEGRAWAELEYLLRGQWDDGMVPQIVFHAPSDDYFPGPDVWRVERNPPTSGITQPPIAATAVRSILDRAADKPLAEAKAAALYPGLLAYHRWWRYARAVGDTGLVATLHPWETGMDNSPAWDKALERVPLETATPIRRKDTTHVNAEVRPRGDEYRRFIHLVDLYRDLGWDPGRMEATTPFRVADVGTNAILLRADRDLLALADRFGTKTERSEIAANAESIRAGIARLWNDRQGIFLSHDLIAGEPIDAATSAGFLPMFGGATTAPQVERLVRVLEDWGRSVGYLVPSAAPTDPRFEARRYWRGPVWAVVNWMIAEGLQASHRAVLAERVRQDTRALIRGSGFAEYFDPNDGTGVGGMDFSWTAAIWLLLN